LTNFKSFYNKTEIALAPLTVLTGTNSSGKSSFIHSILMVAQTLRNPIGSRELVLNGQLIKLGFLQDIQSVDSEVGVSFTCKKLKEMDTESVSANTGIKGFLGGAVGGAALGAFFGPIGSLVGAGLGGAVGAFRGRSLSELSQNPLSRVKCSVSFGNKKQQPSLQSLDLHINFSGNEGVSISARRAENNTGMLIIENISENLKEEVSKKEKNAEAIALSLHHFFPEKIIYAYKKYDKEEIEEKPIDMADYIISDFHNIINNPLKTAERMLEEMLGKNFIDYLQIIRPDEINNKRQELINKIRECMIQVSNTEIQEELSPDTLSTVKKYLSDYFSGSVKYLGPLRFLSSVHPFSLADDPKDVGVSGEYVASVINSFADEEIDYIPPPDNSAELKSDIKKVKFIDALTTWLKYLDVVDSISYEQLGNLGYTLQVRLAPDNKYHDLTQIGVGVSQVLPILTMCLLAEKDSSLLFEQPELHLHPRVQSRLADFFISIALLGKQCIIESHSEYLIYALRYRIAESLLKNDEKIQNAVKLYFAEKKDAKSEFHEIRVNRHGEISAWPDGFFDERQKLSDKMLDAILTEMEGENE
jgi:predicted ATPase